MLEYLPQRRSTSNIWNTVRWQKWPPGNTYYHPGPPTFHQHNQLIPPPLSLLPFLLMYIYINARSGTYWVCMFTEINILQQSPWKCNSDQSFKILPTLKITLSTTFLPRKFWLERKLILLNICLIVVSNSILKLGLNELQLLSFFYLKNIVQGENNSQILHLTSICWKTATRGHKHGNI